MATPLVRGSLYHNYETAQPFVDAINAQVKAPIVRAQMSGLGGESNVSILVLIALQPKEEWTNGILENSKYGRFHLLNDGVLYMFSGGPSTGVAKFRKTRVANVEQVVDKLNKWVALSTAPQESNDTMLEQADRFIEILESESTKEALGVGGLEIGKSKLPAESAPAEDDNAQFEKSKGLEIEHEHANVYELFSKWAKDNKLELPISAEEMYQMIADKHIDESGGPEKSHYYKYLVEMEARIKKELADKGK